MAFNREKLLREYVQKILSEDGGGDGGGGDFGGMGGGMGMGFGGGYVDSKDMYSVFIKPFTDVIDTAKGKTKEMVTATAELARVSMEAILTSLIPIWSSDYKQIFKKYEGQMDDIRSEYKDVYDATWTAFTDNDVVLAAFGMFPSMMITQLAVRKAPIPVIHTVDALTGGFFKKHLDKIENLFTHDEKKPLEDRGGSGGGGGGGMGVYGMGGYGFGDGGGGGGGMGEGLIREKKSSKKKGATQKAQKNDPIAMIMNPKIMAAIDQNPRVQQMMKTNRAAFRLALEELFDRIEKVTHVQDLGQLQTLVGKPIPGLDKLKKLPAEQQRGMSQQIMGAVKKAALNVYVTNLTNQIKLAQQTGVPEGHPMISDLAAAIKKIKLL